jgi:hypothetical protein
MLVAGSLIGAAKASAQDTLTPTLVEQILPAGSTIHITKTLHLDDTLGTHADEVQLAVFLECVGLDITFSPASYTDVDLPVTLTFDETITTTEALGEHKCAVVAVVDDMIRADPELIDITVVQGAPINVQVTPPTATNTVGDLHCVTATVTDAFGQPIPGETVLFSIPTAPTTGATPSSGTRVTDANGQAEFCWTASLPGVDTVRAVVDVDNSGTADPGEPLGTALKTWVLPPSTEICEVKITNGGWFITNAGDQATFGGVAKVLHGAFQGNEEYQDHGPFQPMNLHAMQITAITCTPDHIHATIWGIATINGSGAWVFRLDVSDRGEPGRDDDYGIIVSNGYVSGQHKLLGGNIQIHF